MKTSISIHSFSLHSANKANFCRISRFCRFHSIDPCSCTILTCRKTTPYQNATRHEPTVQVWLALLRYPRDVTTLQVINSLTRTLSRPRQLQLLRSILPNVCQRYNLSLRIARQQFSACNIFVTFSPRKAFG